MVMDNTLFLQWVDGVSMGTRPHHSKNGYFLVPVYHLVPNTTRFSSRLSAWMISYVVSSYRFVHNYCIHTVLHRNARGQILHVAAVLHVFFHLDTPLEIPMEICEQALLAVQISFNSATSILLFWQEEERLQKP